MNPIIIMLKKNRCVSLWFKQTPIWSSVTLATFLKQGSWYYQPRTMQHFSREIPQNYHIFTSTLIPSNMGPHLNNPCLFKGSLSLHPKKGHRLFPLPGLNRIQVTLAIQWGPYSSVTFSVRLLMVQKSQRTTVGMYKTRVNNGINYQHLSTSTG